MKTFEFRLRPTKKQAEKLERTLDLSRLLYNQGLEEVRAHYEETGKHLNRFRQEKSHKKSDHPDLPYDVVNTTIARLHRSFNGFFRRIKNGDKAGYPRFKSKTRWSSFEFRHSNGIEGEYFKTGKVCAGNVRLRLSRPVEGKIKRSRVVRRSSGWYVQFICETEPKPLPACDKAVGIDVGLKHLIADSDGVTIDHPKSLRFMLKKLRRAQRKIARRTKGSSRRRKAVHQVVRMHERIANRRKDILHKISRRYVNSYGTIVMEDLQIANMVRNHHLALSISDASWRMLRHMISYKAEDAGRTFIAVAPHFTSQQCSGCGEMVHKSLSVRTHLCSSCGYCDNRDINAAKNILRLGLSLHPQSHATA